MLSYNQLFYIWETTNTWCRARTLHSRREIYTNIKGETCYWHSHSNGLNKIKGCVLSKQVNGMIGRNKKIALAALNEIKLVPTLWQTFAQAYYRIHTQELKFI